MKGKSLLKICKLGKCALSECFALCVFFHVLLRQTAEKLPSDPNRFILSEKAKRQAKDMKNISAACCCFLLQVISFHMQVHEAAEWLRLLQDARAPQAPCNGLNY